MAKRKSSRSEGRKSPPQGGNRIRTHPASPKLPSNPVRTATKPPGRESRTPTKLTAKDMQERLKRPSTNLPPGLVAKIIREHRDGDVANAADFATAVRRLRNIHAMIRTAALALHAQNAELDRDVACALVHGVVGPMWVQIEVLAKIAGIDLDDERYGNGTRGAA
jgi:hypothetical protein